MGIMDDGGCWFGKNAWGNCGLDVSERKEFRHVGRNVSVKDPLI